ncbi:MAG: DUF6714 family protein [Isosphaeraceae bacterium]
MNILKSIEESFSDVPDPDLLSDCSCEECCWSVSNFIGKHWHSLCLEDAVSDKGDAVIGNLSPAAFRFFLPGLVRIAIRCKDEGHMIEHNLLDCLTVSDKSPQLSYGLGLIQGRLDALDRWQRTSIASFVDYLRGDDIYCPEILRSASQNLSTGIAHPYCHRLLDDWLDRFLNSKNLKDLP